MYRDPLNYGHFWKRPLKNFYILCLLIFWTQVILVKNFIKFIPDFTKFIGFRQIKLGQLTVNI